MFLLKWGIRPYLYFQYEVQKFFKKGSFGPDRAVYVKDPYLPTGNVVKDGLYRYHIKQFYESACSVASIASVVNTLLDKKGKMPEVPVTQQDLLETVKAAHWKERMSEGGYNGRRGLPLHTLGQVVKESMKVYQIPCKAIEIVQATQDPARKESIKQILRSRLEQFETKGDCLLIAHFDQGSFVPDLHIPHISPVGGFDSKTGRVTLLDVDISQTHPYQVSFDTFYKGLSCNYNILFQMFGYGEGGYIFIRL